MPFVRSNQVLSLRFSSKRLPPALVEAARDGLNWLLGFRSFNEVYRRLPPCLPADLSRTYLDAIGARTEFDGEPLSTVPAAGPLILIANYPFGIIEVMALDAMLQSIRRDATVMAVHGLSAVPEWDAHWIFVGPPGHRGRRHLSIRGWRRAFQWVGRGGAIVVFPAGRVALLQWRRMAVLDQGRSPHIAAFAKRTGALVLPVFVHGHNTFRFQLACRLYPSMQDLMIVGEVANKRGRTMRMSLGRLIQPHEISSFTTDEEAIKFLRQRTETLAGQALSATRCP
jgi:putative hemolysin